jgi:tRNA (guanine37-N1)-methyltransferase
MDVPEVLISGNHRLIHLWQFEQSLILTKERRPDLWAEFLKGKTSLRKDERKILRRIVEGD